MGQNDKASKESALFTSQFKGKCRNCGKLDHKAAQCKSKHDKDEKSDVMCNYCKNSGHMKANCFKLLRKNSGMNNSGGTKSVQNGVGVRLM
jgi:Zinc knuckle